MLNRMRGVGGENLLGERVDGETARQSDAVLAIVPELVDEERLGFQIVWKFKNERLKGSN